MEPRFSLPASTPRSSKSELIIGGVQFYIYGLDELKQKSGVEVAVLYLGHNRTRTYLVTEGVAHEVLHRYRTDRRRKKVELIAVTMNMRNHGDRMLSKDANLTWSDGNENHAMDLLSSISGSAQDFKLALDYLPTYLPQFTRFRNIMAGISLGAHTTYRMASIYSRQIEGYITAVGCPNLSSLLLTRLGVKASALGAAPSELEDVSYERLETVLNEKQRRKWPRALADLVSEDDRKIREEFPCRSPILICCGKEDPLVPAFYTASWLKRRREEGLSSGNETFFVQENTGHSCTKEMVALMANWMGNLFEAKGIEMVPSLTESHL